MKRLTVILAVLTLGTLGCQNPDQVQLTPAPEDSANQVEITSLASGDTLSMGAFDSAAVPIAQPGDDTRYSASLSVVRTTYDYVHPLRLVRQIDVSAFSRALFTDRTRLTPGGLGFYGLALWSVKLNGVPMDTVKHLVRVPGAGLVAFGPEYLTWLGGTYLPRTTYTWNVSVKMMDTASASIQSADDLHVQWPVGGSRIDRAAAQTLRWSGKGNLTIVISAYYPLLKTSKALLHVKLLQNTGQLVLGPRVLALLPRDHVFYVLSFILNNRKELTAVNGYSASVLVQASDVYNSFVVIP